MLLLFNTVTFDICLYQSLLLGDKEKTPITKSLSASPVTHFCVCGEFISLKNKIRFMLNICLTAAR
jgi:hypothetical protein